MQTKALSVLFLLSCAQVFAVRELTGSTPRSLLQSSATGSTSAGANSDAGGSAQSSSNAFGQQVGPGSVIVRASAFSSAVAIIRNDFERDVDIDIDRVKAGGVALAVARARADAFASAVASAFASASFSIVSTSNGGRACAGGSATARQAARAVAEAFVQVLAVADNKISFVAVGAAIRAVEAATASAFSTAQANGCVNGQGRANAFGSQFSRALSTVYVEVLGSAFALVVPGAAAGGISVSFNQNRFQVTTVSGFSSANTSGNANAGASTGGGANAGGR